MDLTVTISPRAFYALQAAAANNGTTPEALAAEVVQSQGITYSTIYGVGVMTSAAFVRRFEATEYAAILAAADQSEQVAALIEQLTNTPYVALDDERLAPGLQLLVGAGLLTAARVAEILDYGLTA